MQALRRLTPAKVLLLASLWLVVLVSVAPFVYMILGSFKENYELLTNSPELLPRDGFGLRKYADLIESWPILRNMLNSLVVSLATTVSVTFFSLLVGYSLAKFDFPGKGIVMVIIIATLMVPFEVRLVPQYVLFRDLGLLNSYVGLVLPSAISAFGIFLVRQFAQESIPDELIEAARLEGTSEFRILRSIVAPVMSPALISLALLTFITSWNDFLWPLIAVTDSDLFTVSIALKSLADPTTQVDYGRVLAAAVISVIPVLVVFGLFNRKITEAVIAGSGRES